MRIVSVEDDPVLSQAIKITLEKEGYAVDTFTDSEKGQRYILLNHSNYDLIILDLMMPGRSGVDICKKLRENNIMTPILILTGRTELENKVTALDSGADDYLTKPFSSQELAARVRALLRRPRASLPTTLKIESLTLDPATRTVTYKDKPISLTLKEFSILEYLLNNINTVISRDQILDHVWDSGYNSFSNLVDVHITNLRKKLELAGAPHMLKTIRGVGYSIKP